MSVFGHGFKINTFREFHVFGMNSQDLKPSNLIRNYNVNLSIEPPEPSQGWIDRGGSVSGSDHDHMASSFEAVH